MAIKSKKAARISVQTQKPLAAKNHVPVIPPSPPATDPTTRLDLALDVDDKEEEDTDDSDAIPQGSQVVQRQKTPSCPSCLGPHRSNPRRPAFLPRCESTLKKSQHKGDPLEDDQTLFSNLQSPFKPHQRLIGPDESDDDQNMEEAPKPLPLAGINPNNSSVTYPKLKLPETMKKKAAIALYHQYIMPPPVGGYPTEPFREPSPKVPVPYHGLLTVEELRLAYIVMPTPFTSLVMHSNRSLWQSTSNLYSTISMREFQFSKGSIMASPIE
ncbi:hypothetical protein H4Q26_000490 [Puccinia striiformis f. sp. tritici PST-130]|nr:hypothetical protein H4Q26_000490 [Puccinia striiformis f. sp. tritici PST-130]